MIILPLLTLAILSDQSTQSTHRSISDPKTMKLITVAVLIMVIMSAAARRDSMFDTSGEGAESRLGLLGGGGLGGGRRGGLLSGGQGGGMLGGGGLGGGRGGFLSGGGLSGGRGGGLLSGGRGGGGLGGGLLSGGRGGGLGSGGGPLSKLKNGVRLIKGMKNIKGLMGGGGGI